MNREQTETALNEISDAHIAEASNPKHHKKYLWLAPVAAILAVALLLALPLGPLSAKAHAISTPEYPKMAQFPTNYESPDYDEDMDAWQDSFWNQRSQPEGYADSLSGFWASSIPVFLAGDETENHVYSPLNLYMALAMLAETAGGESREQILSLLGADTIESLRTQAGHVWNAHYLNDGVNSTILANSLWLDEGVSYNKSTLDILSEEYFAGSFRGDLGSAEMNEALQNWLNEQTKGLLKDQVIDEGFPPETVLALASTIYFRSHWTEEFEKSDNTEAPFHTPNGDVTTTFMNQTLYGEAYYWGEDYGAIRLDLEDGSSMWLILPDEGKAPADLLESGGALELALTRGQSCGGSEYIMVNLSLPKFDVVSRMDLTGGLNGLGITDVFDSEKADFSPAMPGLEGVALSEAIHAARVTVDEEGVEAAAYTILPTAGSMPPDEEIDFILDRPFLFVITSHDDLPLFAGVVNEP